MKPLISAGVLLALTILPVVLSKSKVLLGRWITWAGITAAFGLASLYGGTGVAVVFAIAAFVVWFEGGVLQEDAAALGRRNAFAVLAYRCLAAGLSVALLAASIATSPEFIGSLVFIVALFDIGGWVGGKLLTRFKPLDKKLFAKTSPNKTWGGLVGSILLGLAANIWMNQFNVLEFALIAAGALAGDWLESWVKRAAGTKDASDWLPGFGGLLDRVDSLLPMGLVLLVIGF